MSHQRRRTRPLELLEHEYLDLERPIDVELLLDEHDYRLKWPEAPLTKFLNRYLDQQQVSSRTEQQLARSSSQHTRNQRDDYVVVPRVFLDFAEHVEETIDTDASAAKKRPRSDSGPGRSPTGQTISMHSKEIAATMNGGHFQSCGPVMPPPERWDGELHELVTFSDDQMRQLQQVGFPRNFALHSDVSMVDDAYFLAALWGEASVLVTEFEAATLTEHKDKTLRILKLLPLGQAVAAASFRPGWAKGPAWVGSLSWDGVEVLHQHWLQWRHASSDASKPWGTALLPRMHVSLPLDDFFLSQEAVRAIATTGGPTDRTTTQMLLNERRRHGVLPDFNLRLRHERREGAFKAVFGYLPIDVRQSNVWSQQETLWSMIVVGRRPVTQKDVEELVDGLPHPSMALGPTAVVATTPSTTARGAAVAAAAAAKDAAASGYQATVAARYHAASIMLSRELDDARRLLQLSY